MARQYDPADEYYRPQYLGLGFPQKTDRELLQDLLKTVQQLQEEVASLRRDIAPTP